MGIVFQNGKQLYKYLLFSEMHISFFILSCFGGMYRGMGFPGGSVVKNSPANAGDTWDVLSPGSCMHACRGTALC